MLVGAIVYWVSPYQRWKLKKLALAAAAVFLAYAAVVSGVALDVAIALFQSIVEEEGNPQ